MTEHVVPETPAIEVFRDAVVIHTGDDEPIVIPMTVLAAGSLTAHQLDGLAPYGTLSLTLLHTGLVHHTTAKYLTNESEADQ